MVRRTLGKYEITERLGRGGMAEVYRAYHASLDRYVAVKLLHPFLADDPEFKDRFEREARNIARLRHPHIVQVFDFDYDPDGESYYMVMELIEGLTLKDHLTNLSNQSKSLSVAEAIRITIESAQALAYAHKNNMIHRDVKPANLMLDERENNRVVLTDFGIAKIITGGAFTASGGMIGTPAYMSPEQGMGESGDERSDLYSLGVILYQMVTSRLPYDAETPLAIILKHLNEPLPRPRSLNPDLPPWLEAIIIQAMEKDPADRFANADEFIQALERGQNQASRTSSRETFETSKKPVGDGDENAVEKTQTLPVAENMPVPSEATVPMGSTSPTSPIIIQPQPRPLWLNLLTPTLVLIGILVMVGIVLGQGGTGPLAVFFNTETPIPELAQEASPTLTPSATPTDTPSATPTDTPSATPTDTPSATPTDTPSATPTDTPSATPTDTPSATPTDTPSATPTDTPSATPTNTPSATPTDTPSATPTNTPSATPTDTPSATPTDTPSATPTPTPSATPTDTPSATPTPTPSATPSPTLTFTPTLDQTATQAFFVGQTATADFQISFFATRQAITATPDIQSILELCDRAYAIISPEDLSLAPNPNRPHPRFIGVNRDWELTLEIQNTSTCDWPTDLVFLSFIPSAESDLSEFSRTCEPSRIFADINLTFPKLANIQIRQEVKRGERFTITLEGRTGDRFGCYFGTWELRIPDYNLYIGEPFVIAWRVFGGR